MKQGKIHDKKSVSQGVATFVILVASVVLLLGGCGLPDQLSSPPEAPDQNLVRPAVGSINPAERYFEFIPHGSADGTKVFYRIFADKTTLENEIKTIQTYIKAEIDSGVAQSSYNRIVSMGYKDMDTNLHDSYLTTDAAQIQIRLFDENFSFNTGDWKAGIYKTVVLRAIVDTLPTEAELNPLEVTDGSPAKGDLYYLTSDQKIYTLIEGEVDPVTEAKPLIFASNPMMPQSSSVYQNKEDGKLYQWNGTALYETSNFIVPLPQRRNLDNKGFGFFYLDTDTIKSEANPKPVSGDADTNFTGYTDGTTWYVNAYAVSVGQDMNFALSYSRITELGYITISQ
jgi:hypothetical protein